MKKRSARKFPFALLLLFIFPYIVGFAPPDTDGTFIGFSGGAGVFPTASCSQSLRNEYKEGSVSVDHRFDTKGGDWTNPDYVTVGAFGERGIDRQVVIYNYDDETGERSPGNGTYQLDQIWNFGAHVSLDWKFLGLDAGVMELKLPDVSPAFFPRFGWRIGGPQFYVSGSALQGSPLIADGNEVNCGAGTQLGDVQFWAGVGVFVDQGSEGIGILKIKYNFKPVAIRIGLQGAPKQSSSYSPDYGVSLGLDIRVP